MRERSLLRNIAPCGLVCYTCAAAKSGVIRKHARELLAHLEGFEVVAEYMAQRDARLKMYPYAQEALQMLGDAGCEGCREGGCKYPGCEIAPCAKEKGHDFCFECESFPCDKADFEPRLKAKWLHANRRMKQVGPDAYFEEARGCSHYAP